MKKKSNMERALELVLTELINGDNQNCDVICGKNPQEKGVCPLNRCELISKAHFLKMSGRKK